MRTYQTPILNTSRLETSPFCASEEYWDFRISGFTGIQGAHKKNLALKIPGKAKKREGLVSSLEYMLLCMKRERVC